MGQQRQADHGSRDSGFSMVATMLSLVAAALLVALLLGATLHSGSTSTTSISNAPGVAAATGIQAQQALTTALSTASTAAVGAGGFGGLTPSALAASESSITFVAGPTSSASVVSVATAPDQSGGVTGGPTGSITLAARATDGTCWLVWKSATATWYGAQTGLASCSAPALTSAPSPGPVSATAIGWQQGTFPSA